jgi:adenine-specific DNA methylase
VRGSIGVADANVVAASVRKKDLVFIDPPYSDVHYSRFYHVLETVALGECKVVSGVGRYPDVTLRPSSKYSRKREAPHAIDALLKVIALNGAKAVLTFPDHDCSNGLSGSKVRRIAAKYFFVRAKSVNSELSTMGGRKTKTQNLDHRHARLSTSELILVLRPKRAPKRPKRKKTDGSTDVRQRPT